MARPSGPESVHHPRRKACLIKGHRHVTLSAYGPVVRLDTARRFALSLPETTEEREGFVHPYIGVAGVREQPPQSGGGQRVRGVADHHRRAGRQSDPPHRPLEHLDRREGVTTPPARWAETHIPIGRARSL